MITSCPNSLIAYHQRLCHVHNSPSSRHLHPMYSPGEAIRKYIDEAGCTEAAPGDEWMVAPELPTSEEVLGIDSPGSTVYLAPNRIQGPWASSREYLQAHYNLIREDAVAPLRDAVATFQSHPAMKETKDISIYEKVSANDAKGTNE